MNITLSKKSKISEDIFDYGKRDAKFNIEAVEESEMLERFSKELL